MTLQNAHDFEETAVTKEKEKKYSSRCSDILN